MFTIEGKYAKAIIYANEVEQEAYTQIIQFVNSIVAQNSHPRFMPDVHAGAGCTIGFTAQLNEYVVPNLIGVDIGCGVLTCKLPKNTRIDFTKLDKVIRETIPHGHNIHNNTPYDNIIKACRDLHIDAGDFLSQVIKVALHTSQEVNYVTGSLGTLGGGNHFIEVEEGSDAVYLTIHSGSRNFGYKIASYHQNLAAKDRKISKEELQEIRTKYNGKEIERKIQELYQQKKVPKGLEYLTGDKASNYLEDMKIAQTYAQVNRRIMLNVICEKLKLEPVQIIESVHNYIDFDDNIVRKGAIRAHKNETIVVPMNMKFGIVIARGKGNSEWNYSAPHGAGRRLSRRKAKEELSLDEFREVMNNVWSSCVSMYTLDESPMAYKNPQYVLDYLKETAEVIDIAKAIYVFKDN